MKQLSLADKRKNPFVPSYHCRLLITVKWAPFWSSQSQQEASSVWVTHINQQAMGWSTVFGLWIGSWTKVCCSRNGDRLPKAKKTLFVTPSKPSTSPGHLSSEPTHKNREHQEKFLKFSLDNKITSNFPQTTKWLQLIFTLIDCFRACL